MTEKKISNKWKLKAMERAKENNALRKRINEVLDSRDNFRKKYYDLKNLHIELEMRKRKIDKEEKKSARIKKLNITVSV